MGAVGIFASVDGHDDIDKKFQQLRQQSRGEALADGLDLGYTGTMWEKDSYKFLTDDIIADEDVSDFIDKHFDDNDKWGPAFAVRSTSGVTFFGYASE